MNWTLAVNLLTFAVITGGFVAGFFFIRRISREIEEFLSSPGPDSPSPFDVQMDILAQRIAAHVATQVKVTLMGMLSGQSRQDSAAEDIAFAANNPMLSGIVGMLPKKMQKTIRSNPEIAKLAFDKIVGSAGSGLPGGVISAGQSASGNGSKAKFTL